MFKSKQVIFSSILLLLIMIIGTIVYLAPNKNSKEDALSIQAIADEPTSAPEAEIKADREEIKNDKKPESNEDLIVIGNKNKAVIKTISKLHYESSSLNNAIVPEFYSKVEVPGITYDVYAFMDKKGDILFRAYGTKYSMENNIQKDAVTGFFTQSYDASSVKKIIDTGAASPVKDIVADAINPVKSKKHPDLPVYYLEVKNNLYLCYDNSESVGYRTWCDVNGKSMLFPCDENGNVQPGAIPVNFTEEGKNIVDPLNESGSDRMKRYPGAISELDTLTIIK